MATAEVWEYACVAFRRQQWSSSSSLLLWITFRVLFRAFSRRWRVDGGDDDEDENILTIASLLIGSSESGSDEYSYTKRSCGFVLIDHSRWNTWYMYTVFPSCWAILILLLCLIWSLRTNRIFTHALNFIVVDWEPSRPRSFLHLYIMNSMHRELMKHIK